LVGVAAKGYTEPTPIQRRAIPLVLGGRDLIAAAHTGTGKTAAFALPVLTLLRRRGPLRSLILEPTRELAQQVDAALAVYGKGSPLRVALLYGGVGYGRQREALKGGVDIVVATPGRLLDHLEQRTLSLDRLEILILDEADRMLDMGFIPQVRRIIRQCPRKRQSMLFSATLGPEIERVAGWVLRNPVRASVGSGKELAKKIKHAVYPVDDRQKFDLLLAILTRIDYRSVIIFCRTKVGAEMIGRWLEAVEHRAVILHSDRSQKERERALQGFKSGKDEILVATDIVSRGIDIADVSHVINYDIPQHAEDYVHRLGRTGRMSKEGDAVTLYTASDREFLQSIENFVGQPIERRKLEGFDYNWSPVLEEKKPLRKRRNRGFSSAPVMNLRRGRRA
jgi:ATP-dependent RNA helicase RhlE